MPLSTGKILNDRYRIVKLLGEGGFGAVYRAWDMNLRGPCAVKENFDSSPEAQSQFAREASILYNLRHPNLPKVIDHFSIPGQGQYLVMEYIEGQDLQEMIDAGTEDQAAGVPLPEERVLAWAQQVCDALIYLHSRKPPIIHRDIKPANIRISPEGMANLVDFGIAKVYDPERKTTLGARAVTPGFAPFEQYGQRPTDARTDVYALGATLYASLTGQAPMESIERVGGGRLPSPRELNPSISKGVDAAIMRAMEIMPDQRFQSMADFKHALLPGGAAVFAAGVSAGVASEPVPSQYTSVGVQPSGESTQARGDEAPLAGKAKKISRRWILFGALAGLILTCIFCTILGSLGEQDRAAGVSKTAKALTGVPVQSSTPLRVPTALSTASTLPAPPVISPKPFICVDPLGCVDVAPGDPVRIASALVTSGPNADLGIDSLRGVEIAIEFRGGLLGHPIELQAEDDGCSAEGGQAAGQKIVSNASIVAVVGSSCSSAGAPMSKVISDAGYVMVSPSNTAPALTAPSLHQPGYLRTAHNDQVQGRVMAEFAFNVLGKRKAAAIHDGDPYTEGLARVFAEAFEGLGGEIVDFAAVNKGDSDVRPVLTAVAAAGPPEFLYYPVFTVEGGLLTRQAREIAGLEGTILAAADGMISEDAIEAVGEAGEGMYFSGPDLAFSVEIYDRFMARYREKYGTEPISVFHAHAFDAANMIFACIEKIAVQDADGALHIGRQALRDCLFATRDFTGITGNLTCDPYGDCADAKISVSQLQSGRYVRIWP